MTITYHPNVVQGSDDWAALRRGLLTASEIRLILTPTLKIASNDKERAHLYELLAQRITGYVEPAYISDDMLRGINDEAEAAAIYSREYAQTTETGFITNDKWGFTIGYSPDRLVGDKGLLECKSRRQKYQLETIVSQEVPAEYMLQLQTGLLVSEREWIDFCSYCGGMHMVTIRVFPDQRIQDAIVAAASDFEGRLVAKLASYNGVLASGARLVPTERKIIQEMYV